MATTPEQFPVLVTRQEKERIARLASEAGMSMGEFLRLTAESFHREDETEMLKGLIDQMLKTTGRTSDVVDDALEFVDASNRRMAALGNWPTED
jgi:hypothetical protein